MEKLAFLAAILAGVVFANVCCTVNEKDLSVAQVETAVNKEVVTGTLGGYLAGRMAYLRHDVNKAADYYMSIADQIPENQKLSSMLYLILTSQGRIDEAVKYADESLKNNDKSPFIYTVKAVHAAKKQNYDEALTFLDKSDNQFAQMVISPLLKSWIYAGQGDYDQAMKQLESLAKQSQLSGIARLTAGEISDYTGHTAEADICYTALMKIKGMKLFLYPTRILANFYLRQDNREKVDEVIKMSVIDDNKITSNLIRKIQNSDSSVAPIITDSAQGLAGALFHIAMILRQDKNAEELALLFASLSGYVDENYDMPRVMIGDILDDHELYAEANNVYRQIDSQQSTYFSAQLQIAKNLMLADNYAEAEQVLQNLKKDYSDSSDVYLNLAEAQRLTKDYKEAINNYNLALNYIEDQQSEEAWPIYWALGMSYDGIKDYDHSEEAFRKAYAISPNRMLKNHLGYTLINHQRNFEEAFALIVEAYVKDPRAGSVVDSLGWALYQAGQYHQAVEYLQQASDLSPSEALIYDHLGDAYWEVGRHREAVYQWNHALRLNDESGELDKTLVEDKIKNGKKAFQPWYFDKEWIDKFMAENLTADNLSVETAESATPNASTKVGKQPVRPTKNKAKSKSKK